MSCTTFGVVIVVLAVFNVKLIDVALWRIAMMMKNNSVALVYVLNWFKGLPPWQFIVLVVAVLLGYLLK